MLGRYKRHFLAIGIISAFLFLLNGGIFAASTGKIMGTITDDKGEPVIGASVQVIGTNRGDQTDFDGKYVITQLEPGVYSIKITHLEFNTVEISEIQVKADLTS
ncbi:MAG: carboxypeptidase regulatory-like domain-containing protein, partial [bacterium]